ncbi:hypothetical protein [Marihabitans asiaticum]|uniref:Uncharacterized protein n=1 Tax=Marihabitans asiaticum TaxID=415218 RepID=A0A560WGH8_9MICO|nr:hypothetical protein [Marihabitans asiaticum]TWD16791.1 hypothetical protein FB557_0328 [Marihabitans asiaticum]
MPGGTALAGPTEFLEAALDIALMAVDTSDDVPLLESFLEVDIAETTALLHLAAAVTEDELTAMRIRRVLEQRLGSPEVLTGERRAEIIAVRDSLAP